MLSFWGQVQLNTPYFPMNSVEKPINEHKENRVCCLQRNICWVLVSTSPDTATGWYRYSLSNGLKLFQTHDEKGIRLLQTVMTSNTAFDSQVACRSSIRTAGRLCSRRHRADPTRLCSPRCLFTAGTRTEQNTDRGARGWVSVLSC